MPKIRTLVPLTHPKTGEQFAAGVEVDVADEVYAEWRADGKVTASEKDQKAGQLEASPEGVYNARTTRADAGQPEEESSRAKAEEKKK